MGPMWCSPVGIRRRPGGPARQWSATFRRASLELLAIDLSDLVSVRRAAEKFRDGHDRLDLLINNAGVMGTPYRQTADGFELQMATNHLGHFALTGLLLDRLLTSGRSRVVTVSSLMHRSGLIDFDDVAGLGHPAIPGSTTGRPNWPTSSSPPS